MSGQTIVTQARTWLGTPYHHQGRLKGKGCDCLGLLIGVADELKLKQYKALLSDIKNTPAVRDALLSDLDNTHYPTTPNTTELLQKLNAHLYKVHKKKMQVGDIAVMDVFGNPQHLGIISDYPSTGWGTPKYGLIHCLQGVGVTEHHLSDPWRKRIKYLYRYEER